MIVLGVTLIALALGVSILTASGLFGTDYYRACVIRIIPTAERKAWSPLAWVVVSDPQGHDRNVIVRRGDNRDYNVGDSVVICQPFGPPHIVPGMQGSLTLLFRDLRVPFTGVGVGLIAAGIVVSLSRRQSKEETETEPSVRK